MQFVHVSNILAFQNVTVSGEQAAAGDTSLSSPNITEPADQLCSNGILLLDDLVKTLRNYYGILYNDLRPVHVDQNEHFQVGKLFCDNNMQFMKTEKLTGNNIWEKVDSHHNVIGSVKVTGTVVIIEGDVGYGKTMISLKLIQEWCENDKKSSLKGVEVVIFLRVNELTKFSSLYGAIQSALLPKDSKISSTDIEEVLINCQSVVIILDDYEERHQKLVWLTDILKKKTLRHCKVVITTRSFEFVKSIVISSKRFRLTAFSEETRKAYIHNYVGKQGKKFVEQVKTELLENVVLNELCKIPLLLVAYIHLICEQTDNREPKSWISIFSYLLKCFELHHQNKTRHHADVLIFSETEAREKGKVIAKFLSTDQDQHATEHYEPFKRLGLFRHPISTESKEEVQCTILAELYAAKNTENMEKTELEHFVKLLNLNQICFLPLFASYFNEHFLDTFINCYRDMEIPATWLKYELNRKLSTIRDSLTKFCSEHVDITTCEYPLLQRSKIELLKLASNNKIPIEDVSFTNCVDVELSTKDMLVITSGMEIPVLETVKKITFDGKQTKIKNEEAELMLMYCNHCSHLETVQFRRLTMPGSLKNCTKFLRKEITVLWNSADGKEFVLQMQSGLWNDLQLKNTQRKKKTSLGELVKNKFGKSTNEVDEVDTVPDTGSPIDD
ncbi:uncharacterized protein [Apostichopus japonicus]|uniref:uncharacterized protein n=1 Tax=Stichopus japonicus TaxID=307972 RepID=UPI003AB36D08